MTLTQEKIVRQTAMFEMPAMSASPPVLARDADATYWMSRYIERAEYIARLLTVHSEALVDVGDVAEELLEPHWLSVPQILNVLDLPQNNDPLPQRVADYMTFNAENLSSMVRCLTRARENARGIREVISSEMWEQLNMLYWSIRDDSTSAFRESPDQLYQRIIIGSMLFQGLTDQTLEHGQRWYFAQLGKYFERVTIICRILLTKLKIAGSGEENALANIHWITALRSSGAIETYRRTHLGEIDALHIAQFLILEENIPRSVRYCVRQAHRAISSIRELIRPRSIDPAERVLGRLDAQLEFLDPVQLAGDNLKPFLENILACIAEAAISVQTSFFLH